MRFFFISKPELSEPCQRDVMDLDELLPRTLAALFYCPTIANASLAVRFEILRLQCLGFVVLRCAIATVLFDRTVSVKIIALDASVTEIIAWPEM